MKGYIETKSHPNTVIILNFYLFIGFFDVLIVFIKHSITANVATYGNIGRIIIVGTDTESGSQSYKRISVIFITVFGNKRFGNKPTPKAALAQRSIIGPKGT